MILKTVYFYFLTHFYVLNNMHVIGFENTFYKYIFGSYQSPKFHPNTTTIVKQVICKNEFTKFPQDGKS